MSGKVRERFDPIAGPRTSASGTPTYEQLDADLADLLSACKQWRQATESRLRYLDSRGEAAKSMLPADRALCEAIDGVES